MASTPCTLLPSPARPAGSVPTRVPGAPPSAYPGGDQGRWRCRTAAPAVAVVPTAVTAARNTCWSRWRRSGPGPPRDPERNGEAAGRGGQRPPAGQQRADRPGDQQADQAQVRAAGRIAGRDHPAGDEAEPLTPARVRARSGPAYHAARSMPGPERGPSPARHAGISSPATTLIALLFRAALSTAAPRPRRARYTAVTAPARGQAHHDPCAEQQDPRHSGNNLRHAFLSQGRTDVNPRLPGLSHAGLRSALAGGMAAG
jgi:hypothetical protein